MLRLYKVRVDKLKAALDKTKNQEEKNEKLDKICVTSPKALSELKRELLDEKQLNESLRKRIEIFEKNKVRPISAKMQENKERSEMDPDKISQMRVTINKMKDNIDELKKEIKEKTKQINELKDKTSLGKCKKLEEELKTYKARSEEFEKSHNILQALESAYKEYKNNPKPENSETKIKGEILISIKATLTAWNNCPSYVKSHMEKQDAKIKELEEKLKEKPQKSNISTQKSKIQSVTPQNIGETLDLKEFDKHEKNQKLIDKLKKELEQVKGENTDLKTQLGKLKLLIKTS